MRTRWVTAALVPVLGLGLLTACGQDPVPPAADDPSLSPSASEPRDDATDPGPDGPSASPSDRSEPDGTEVVAAGSDFGTVLFDATGQALYLFDVETTTEPRCYGECAEAWPPVLTDGEPVAGKQVRQALLGTVRRTDGTTQVTYGGHPLYFYAHEGKREVRCHDVFLNGGTWYAVAPDGGRAP